MPALSRPAWNDSTFCSEEKKYALSKEALLKRKRLLVSKHNIFASEEDLKPSSVLKNFANKPRTLKSAKDVTNNVKNMTNPLNVDHSDTDHDATVLELLRTPTKIGSVKGYAGTPNAKDVTYDVMDPSVSHSYDQTPNLDYDDDASWASINRGEIDKDDQKLIKRRNRLHNDRMKIAAAASHKIKVGSDAVSSGKNSRLRKTYAKNANPNIFKKSTADTQANSDFISSNRSNEQIKEISKEITTLFQELRYYEQLTGRRSTIDVDQSSVIDILKANPDSCGESVVSVLHALTRLVCQTMSYLLKSEVEIQGHRDREHALTARVDTLTALIMPHSASVFMPQQQVSKEQQLLSVQGSVASRVSADVLNGHVQAMLSAQSEALGTCQQDIRCCPAVGLDFEEEVGSPLPSGSVNISLSEGKVDTSPAPFQANLSPVRDMKSLGLPPRPAPASSLQAHFTGSSTTDLLFGSEPVCASLTESVGPHLQRAAASVARVEDSLGFTTPSRTSTPIPAGAQFSLNDATTDDDSYWAARLSAVDALHKGVSQLSVAVTTVRNSPVVVEAGPYSRRSRSLVEEGNNVQSNGTAARENVSIIVPQQAPSPAESPPHPFSDNCSAARYARVGVNATK